MGKGDSYSNLRRLMSADSLPDTETGKEDFYDEMENAKMVYRGVLSGITGGYTAIKVRQFNITDDTQREKYEEILNDPDVTILREETSFAISETRMDNEYFKETQYIVSIKYKVSDFDKVFEKMNAYLDDLEKADPPLISSSGLRDLLVAWGFFFSEIPPSKRVKYQSTVIRMKNIVDDIDERREKAKKEAEKEAKSLVKTLLDRSNIFKEVIDDPDHFSEEGRGEQEQDEAESPKGKTDKRNPEKPSKSPDPKDVLTSSLARIKRVRKVMSDPGMTDVEKEKVLKTLLDNKDTPPEDSEVTDKIQEKALRDLIDKKDEPFEDEEVADKIQKKDPAPKKSRTVKKSGKSRSDTVD